LGNANGGIGAVLSPVALRVLGVVDKISDCALLAPNLIQFQRHPCAKVRSKAALMLGRCNLNVHRVECLLDSDDARQRANAVESLWGYSNEKVRTILWNATQDSCSRVVLNALVGLCQGGDREAYRRLAELANEPDPVVRSGTAWAMGQIGDPEFGEALEKLEQDVDAKVRDMAAKSRKKLHVPPPVIAPAVEAAPKPVDLPGSDTAEGEDAEPEKIPTRDSNQVQYVRIG
jgi:HEAT repeat protein